MYYPMYKTAIIIGAGPSGIAAYLRLKQNNVDCLILEAGDRLKHRLNDKTSSSIVNGFGGAGPYSDRKWSSFPAGTGLLNQNPYELRDSFKEIISYLKEAIPDHAEEFENLMTTITDFLGDNTVSSEVIENRKVTQDDLKLYPSVVLSSFDKATELLYYFENKINDEDIKFGCFVNSIEKKHNSDNYIVSYPNSHNSSVWIETSYVICATGRFGPYMGLLNEHNPMNLQSGRLEIGVRLDVDKYPQLKTELLKFIDSEKKYYDPKLRLKRTFLMKGKHVDVEFRTFCVCTPITGSGYSVLSKDIVTGLQTVSGSSSFEECSLRESRNHVIKGSNLGIMMRITDPSIVNELRNTIKFSCKNNNKSELVLDPMDELDVNIEKLSAYYPADLCNALYCGIAEVIRSFTGNGIVSPITVYGPCVEGVGCYPTVDKRTYEIINRKGLYVVGDATGFARGLLQAFVMGDMCAKYVSAAKKEAEISYLLEKYQSISLPNSSYNKVITNNVSSKEYVNYYGKMEESMEKLISESFNDEEMIASVTDRAKEIVNEMIMVKFTGSNNYGVLYELHHFFLDKSIYGTSGQLHYISENAMVQYIFMCNIIEKNKERLANIVFNITSKMCEHNDAFAKDMFDGVLNSVKNHIFKSCVLALRTRESIEKRDDYTDIPVMQSAFKFKPFDKELYDQIGSSRFSEVKDIEMTLTAVMASLLDNVMKALINNNDLSLILGRTKIETQEPAISPMCGEALYYECHVKMNMTNKDGTDLDYYVKKKLIHTIAGLFEGDNALVDGIFNVISVSINLLKHPEYGQQFFLTYRTDTKHEMEYIRGNFSKIVNKAMEISKLDEYKVVCYTDAEFVIYDDNRPLDLPWFPVDKHFVPVEYKTRINELLTATKNVILVTSNKNKYREFKEISAALDTKISFHKLSLDLGQFNSVDMKTDAERKAKLAFKQLNRPVIIESSGLEFENSTYPGALTSQTVNGMGLDMFAKSFGGTSARATTYIVEYNGIKMRMNSSFVTGKISNEPRGKNGFGWDSIFIPNGSSLTFGEMSSNDKNSSSMRRQAISAFVVS